MNALYDRVDGQTFFNELVEHFYLGVAGDPLLRPLYPDDLRESKEHLALFLGQYWGGPAAYNEIRGHPRLRLRHAPFVIGPPERDAWLRHMRGAVTRMVADGRLSPEDSEELGSYFAMAADNLVNTR